MAIWLGKNVPANVAVEVIKMAKKRYSLLKYIHISGDHDSVPPKYVHNNIFIGGAEDTALRFKIKPLKDTDFEKLYKFTSISDLHQFIRSFY